MKYVLAVLALLSAGSAFAQKPGTKLFIPAPDPSKTVDDGNRVITTKSPEFNLVLQAEIFKAKLPFTIVNDSTAADYVVQWAAIPEEDRSNKKSNKELYTVSASLLGKDKSVVWAGSADKKNLRDCAVVITHQLQDAMKHDTK
jgi:hypothetical protein